MQNTIAVKSNVGRCVSLVSIRARPRELKRRAWCYRLMEIDENKTDNASFGAALADTAKQALKAHLLAARCLLVGDASSHATMFVVWFVDVGKEGDKRWDSIRNAFGTTLPMRVAATSCDECLNGAILGSA